MSLYKDKVLVYSNYIDKISPTKQEGYDVYVLVVFYKYKMELENKIFPTNYKGRILFSFNSYLNVVDNTQTPHNEFVKLVTNKIPSISNQYKTILKLSMVARYKHSLITEKEYERFKKACSVIDQELKNIK